jgi:hypothetical protein
MEGWSFLSNHGRVLLCIAHDPGVRLRVYRSKTRRALRDQRVRGVAQAAL